MQSLRYLLLPFQFLLIFQLTRNTEHKKKARVAKNECNQIFSMIYACRATPWGESILEEREGEATRATEISGIKWGMGTVKGKERKRERVEAYNGLHRGAIATICINAFLDHWPELLNIGPEYTQTSLLTCLMGNFRRNKPSNKMS